MPKRAAASTAQLGLLFEDEPAPAPVDPNDLPAPCTEVAALYEIGNRCDRLSAHLDREPLRSNFLGENITPEISELWKQIQAVAREFERERQRLGKVYGVPFMQKACMDYWASRHRQTETRRKAEREGLRGATLQEAHAHAH